MSTKVTNKRSIKTGNIYKAKDHSTNKRKRANMKQDDFQLQFEFQT